jgi:TonB family protein
VTRLTNSRRAASSSDILLPRGGSLNRVVATRGGRKRGEMIEAWTQWEGHVVNGEFHLKKLLGGSSRSGVFLAYRHGKEQEQATIKLIPANTTGNGQYLSSWSLAEGLSHPHLIRLIEKGRCQLGPRDLLFVVTEYAEENLAEILPERALSPSEVLALLEPTLDVLSYLHRRGIVHGHLKPANILATGNQIKLACDGLSTAEGAPPPPAKLDAYDPPERASGAISPAADIWSLGMTLAEALTQRVPVWHEQEDPVVSTDVPAPLFEIVRGCLRRDPQRRLTIADIRARLHPSSASPQRTQASTPLQPAGKPRPGLTNQSLITSAAIAVLTVAVLFGGLGLLRHEPEARQDRAAASPVKKPEAKPVERASTTPGQQASIGGNNPVVASRIKPSPVPGRPPIASNTQFAEAPVTRIDHPTPGGEVVREVLPDVPQTARDTIQGTIRVEIKVLVDPSGNVVGAELDSPGPSRYFARLATQAAQEWRFSPSNQLASREYIVTFDFRNTETRASAVRAP